MSSEMLTTADLRSASRDYKRDEEQKKKWAFGPKYTSGRVDGAHPRPLRVSDRTAATNSRIERHAAVKVDGAGKAKLARKQDMLSERDDYTTSDDSSASAEEDVDAESTAPAPDAQVMYSFDASRAPTQGSQILNAALAKAIDQYEDTQTTKLVQNEYEVLDGQADDDEESMGLTPGKGKSKLGDAEDAEYEFV